MKTNWKQKLTSRKLWAAIVSFVSLLVLAFGGTQSQATQIAAIIMAGASVMAYIIGEGMIDAASATPPVTVIPTAGQLATTAPSEPVTGNLDSSAAATAVTGTMQAAEVKQNVALSSRPENGAVASGTTGAV